VKLAATERTAKTPETEADRGTGEKTKFVAAFSKVIGPRGMRQIYGWLLVVLVLVVGTLHVQADLQATGYRNTALAPNGTEQGGSFARCSFFGRISHSRMPMVRTPARLKPAQV
jgi:hypothetical protein